MSCNSFLSSLTFMFFCINLSPAFSQSLGDQFEAQERAEKLKKLRNADEQAIQSKRHPKYTTTDLIQRGRQLNCDFSSVESTSDQMTLQTDLMSFVLIDSNTVRVDYSSTSRSYEAGEISGVLVKVGTKIQNFHIDRATGIRSETPSWEFDEGANTIFVKDLSKIYKGICTVKRFVNSR